MTALCNCGKPNTHKGSCHARWNLKRKGSPNNWNKVYHDPDDLCGGRRLQGSEFDRRKAELEARDRAQRERAQA